MAMGIWKHVDEEALERYTLGHLAEADIERIEQHLLICETCQHRVEEADQYVRSMRAAARRVERNPPLWDRAVAAARTLWAHRRSWKLPLPAWNRPVLTGMTAIAACAVLLITALPDRHTPYQEVRLTRAVRGAEPGVANAEAGQALRVSADLTGLPVLGSYRMELADAEGRIVWQGVAAPRDSSATVEIDKKPGSGRYWVRIYDPAGDLLREFGLRLD